MNNKSTGKMRFAKLTFLLAWLAVPLLAVAQEPADIHPLLAAKYGLNVGIFFPERSFEIGVDASLPGIETQIDIS
ncbi:MAG: hypothetical protein KAJ57_09550, partial [Woeseiaceae bacterium]|nr:hypothetical protein [Woeseiaceae bacterium]